MRRTAYALGFGGGGDAPRGFLPTRKGTRRRKPASAPGETPGPGARQEGARFHRVTTGAILTFASALAVPIFRLIEVWMEQRRQGEARRIICQAAKENPEALKILAQLEKEHSNVIVELAKVRAPMLAKLRKPD